MGAGASADSAEMQRKMMQAASVKVSGQCFVVMCGGAYQPLQRYLLFQLRDESRIDSPAPPTQ